MMRRGPRKTVGRRNPRAGAVAVEFALILPLFTIMLFGMIEYGWIFYQQFNPAGAVRDGVRQGVTFSQTITPDAKAQAGSVALADLQRLGVASGDITLSATYAGAIPTKTMTLSGTVQYRKLVGLVPTPTQLRYSMTMMLEQQ